MKVYLVYDIFYDNEECTTYDYLQEIHSSKSAAQEACERLANQLLLDDDTATHRGIDEDGNIVVYKSNDDEDHFVIEEWTVAT